MESALAESDYCLLLWSRNAAHTPWVQVEWESALYRSVKEKRAFLVAGRLENLALPALLAPRLRVDLFPELMPGLGQLIDQWKADRSAESLTQRPVAPPSVDDAAGAGAADTIYITSEAFGITAPLKVELHAPAGLLLDRVVAGFRLPKIWHHEGRIGVRFTYSLVNGDRVLDRAKALGEQDVGASAVLWLKTQMTQFSEAEPVAGSIGSATFRGQSGADALREARRQYLSAVRAAGLGR